MSLIELPVGGLQSREEDEQVPFNAALEAVDCYLDRDSVRGRNGYRSALSGAIVGSGTPQLMGRHRPNKTSARTIAGIAGVIYTITDPSSETASDAVATSLGSKFGSTANLSGAELNREFYVATDESGVAWGRVKSDFSWESLDTIPQPSIASAGKGSLSWFTYRGGAISHAESGCALSTTVSGLLSTWYGVVGTGGDSSQPSSGATVVITLNSAVDITGVDWIAFGVTPPDTTANGGTGKQVVVELSSDNSNFYPVGTITDVPPVAGTPNLIFCNILASNMPAASRAAWKYVRFTVNDLGGGSTLRYGIYGHLIVPNRRNPQPQQYFVSIKNTGTGERSNLSSEFDVTVTDSDAKLPTYTDQYIGNDSFKNTANLLGPLDPANQRNWNQQSGTAEPTVIDIGVPVTLSGTAPTLVGAGPFQAELWTQTQNGIRLVQAVTVTSGGSWSIVDNGGIGVLQNEQWVPTGTPPQATCLTAMAGRLIAGYENRLWISSFIAPVDTVNGAPFPSFPNVPIQDSDGWAEDIAPSNKEQILVVYGVTGDSLYICTNEWCKMMRDLTPGSKPFNVLDRGVMGRQAYCFGDNTFFWASWDGIYAVQNQANWSEISQDIRRIYTDWFQPDSTVVLGYKDRKLYAFRGTVGLRLDMVTGRWTRMNVADTFALSMGFRDPSGTIQQLWFMTSASKIGRWQDAATSDMMVGTSAGTAIPNWTYSTGFMVRDVKVRNKFAYLDITGSVSAGLAKTVSSVEVTKTFSSSGEHELSLAPTEGYKWRLTMTAANTIFVKRMMLEQEATLGKGG